MSLDEFPPPPLGRTLSVRTAPGWLDRRFETLLPELVALSSDEALLAWLTNEARRPSSVWLRYAALLAYHLWEDMQMESILARAEAAKAAEDRVRESKGLELKNRDRQRAYPQEWSHARFVKFLNACPRD